MSNDKLVDTLLREDNINDAFTEQVFRLTDRRLFFPGREAHENQPAIMWRTDEGRFDDGLLHLSSPSIYALALKHLRLETGDAFLNIGSGSGYFNTLAGFFVGDGGINVGIEPFQKIVDYSNRVLNRFSKSAEVLVFPWCKPVFYCTDVMTMEFLDSPGLYNKIYVGAAVHHQTLLKKLATKLRVGGRLVAPVGGTINVVIRVSDDKCCWYSVGNVHFHALKTFVPGTKKFTIPPPPPGVPTLKTLARAATLEWFRQLTRQNAKLPSNLNMERRRTPRFTNHKLFKLCLTENGSLWNWDERATEDVEQDPRPSTRRQRRSLSYRRVHASRSRSRSNQRNERGFRIGTSRRPRDISRRRPRQESTTRNGPDAVPLTREQEAEEVMRHLRMIADQEEERRQTRNELLQISLEIQERSRRQLQRPQSQQSQARREAEARNRSRVQTVDIPLERRDDGPPLIDPRQQRRNNYRVRVIPRPFGGPQPMSTERIREEERTITLQLMNMTERRDLERSEHLNGNGPEGERMLEIYNELTARGSEMVWERVPEPETGHVYDDNGILELIRNTMHYVAPIVEEIGRQIRIGDQVEIGAENRRARVLSSSESSEDEDLDPHPDVFPLHEISETLESESLRRAQSLEQFVTIYEFIVDSFDLPIMISKIIKKQV